MSNPKKTNTRLQLFITDLELIGDPIKTSMALSRVLSSSTVLQQKQGTFFDQQLEDYETVSLLIEVFAQLGINSMQNLQFNAQTLEYTPRNTKQH